MSDMYEKLKMDVADPMPEDKFDSSEPYNEQEEDISGLKRWIYLIWQLAEQIGQRIPLLIKSVREIFCFLRIFKEGMRGALK